MKDAPILISRCRIEQGDGYITDYRINTHNCSCGDDRPRQVAFLECPGGDEACGNTQRLLECLEPAIG